MEWTPSQEKAVTVTGKTLLVSAGAGSGKTTVLVQRIIDQIRSGASISDYLIVTFTRASAADLKDKFYRAISELANGPDARRFRSQLYRLSGARISTIHSFCLEIVRANFQKLGLSPKVRMANEQEISVLSGEVMETVIDAFYEEGSADFLLLADTFSGEKSDEALLSVLLDLYDSLRAYTDWKQWLRDCISSMEADKAGMEQGLFSTRIGAIAKEKLCTSLADLASAAEALYLYVAAAAGDPKGLDAPQFWADRAHALHAAADRSYRDFLETLQASLATRAPNASYKQLTREAEDFYRSEMERLKSSFDWIRETFALGNEALYAEQLETCIRVVRALYTVLLRYDDLLMQAKREKAFIDFSDAEHLLLELLEENGQPSALCRSLQAQLREVCIDEYQDVSPLQDRIFTLLSNGRNRFMVGDVKQSIYRFRNAYPDIFLSYKDAFPDVDTAEDSENARIFLRENFRSGEKILRFTNLLFARVTEGTAYEREYRGEELVFSRRTNAPQLPVTVALFPHEGVGRGETTEQEAAYIAEEILRLVQSGTVENKDGTVRPYRYGDISLLFRTMKGVTKPYEDALRARGIPFAVTKAEPFFEQPEILLMLALLKAVDDPSDDIALVGAMRSPVGDFTAQELYSLRTESPSGPFYRALQKGAEAGTEKCIVFIELLEELRQKAQGSTCHAFLWELYTRTGLLHLCTRREKKGLLLLYELAREFESGGYRGLSGFLAYLKAAQEKGVELPGAADGEQTDRVTLTTIHKSKGLEYPAVFLCACDRQLFGREDKKKYRLLRKEGLFFKLRDYGKVTVVDPFINRLAAMIDRDAELGEELRKLYVACTRAREKLYITGSVQEKKLEQGRFDRRAPSCFLDLVLYAIREQTDDSFECIRVNPEEIGLHLAREIEEERDRRTEGAFLTPETEEALRFRYPYADQGIPAKVSVSELKERFADARLQTEYTVNDLTCAPPFLSETTANAAERGTANHVFLQFCSFERVEQDGIGAEIAHLRQTRMLSEEQIALLDEQGLARFFASALYRRMRSSAHCYREMRFSVREDARLYGGSEGETVLLQGVIDCFFEEADGTLTVVDYKTDRVPDGATLRRKHATQLECYKRAVEAMTGKTVGRCALWSFALGKEV